MTSSSKKKKRDAVSTLDIDRKVRRRTTELQDHKQLAKLAAGDMVAVEAHYHLNCLISFYNQTRQINSSTNKHTSDSQQGIAFADNFLEVQHASVSVNMYLLKLEELGLETASQVNSLSISKNVSSCSRVRYR